MEEENRRIERFEFRDLHPHIFMGTASDRYAGWIGQIYSPERYGERITRRSKKIGKKTFQEDVLPVESVEEYFRHYSVLEIDFTFYGFLLDRDLKPTRNFHVLRTYRKYLHDGDRLFVKVPQVVFATRLWRGGKFIENPDYLDDRLFVHHFYEPANDLLGDLLKGFVFEQEYQTKKQRAPSEEYLDGLRRFLRTIPEEGRYHMEIRTESYLSESYFQLLEEHGVGQVLSHWTWLPPLRRQFMLSNYRLLNSHKQCVVRLLTPLKMRYEEAYGKTHPFDKMIDGMMSPAMVEETVDLMSIGIDRGVDMNIIVNNRAGGNAPAISQEISREFLKRHSVSSPGRKESPPRT